MKIDILSNYSTYEINSEVIKTKSHLIVFFKISDATVSPTV